MSGRKSLRVDLLYFSHVTGKPVFVAFAKRPALLWKKFSHEIAIIGTIKTMTNKDAGLIVRMHRLVCAIFVRM